MSSFDPMTGQPIEETDENVTETTSGEVPIVEAKITSEQAGVTESQAPAEDRIIGYNPMTGDPIRERDQQVQSQMNFDPMTGRPINSNLPVADRTLKETNMKKGVKNAPIIIGVITAALLLVIVAIFSGVFSSKATKVMNAVTNTFKDTSKSVEAFKGFYVILGDNYTADMELYAEGSYIEVEYSTKKNDKQIIGIVKTPEMPEMEILAGIDSSEVKMQLPDISDYVFVYNYKEEKDGFLVDELKEDTIEAIDLLCEMIYANKTQLDGTKSVTKIFTDAVKELEFETVDKKEYKVKGKNRDCKGYKVEVTEDFFLDLIDTMEESLDPEYVEMMEEMNLDVDESYDDMREQVEGMEDMELTFYIYKGKLACLLVEIEKEEMEIIFKDCKKGMHDIEICVEGDTLMEIEGSIDGDLEIYEVELDGKEFAVAEYDTKSGDYEMELMEGSNSIIFKGNLKSTSKGASFSLDEIEEYGKKEDVSLAFTVEKGASMEAFDGEEINIGTATEEELKDVVSEFNY